MAEDLSNKYLFKLIRGGHVDKTGSYNANDGKVIQSDTDLAARFGKERFELIRGPVPPAAQVAATPKEPEEKDELPSMTVKELKKLAEEHEIDISTVPSNDKEALIRTIRESLGG